MKVFNKEEIVKKIDMKKVSDAVESAYIALKEGKVIMPNRMFMNTLDGGDLLLGPSYIKGSGYFGAKVSAYTPSNVALPKVNGVFVLFNEVDGSINSIFDSEVITAHRTAAKSAVAAKYLANKNSKSIGVLGMGTQALLHTRYFAKFFNIQKVKAWSRNIEIHNDFIDVIKDDLGIVVEILEPSEVVTDVDIVIDATYSTMPLVNSKDINIANFVLGLNHSANAIEFDEEFMKSCNAVYVDFEQNLHAGTLQSSINKNAIQVNEIGYLKDIVSTDGSIARKGDSPSSTDRVYFQSGGVSIEDLACAISLVS